jgi:hypothetical protein
LESPSPLLVIPRHDREAGREQRGGKKRVVNYNKLIQIKIKMNILTTNPSFVDLRGWRK